jgi:hypothetical protein
MARRGKRKKISISIASENVRFLHAMIKRGEADSLSEALDQVVLVARRAEARQKLEAETEAYYATMSDEEIAEENRLGAALSFAASQVNFDE